MSLRYTICQSILLWNSAPEKVLSGSRNKLFTRRLSSQTNQRYIVSNHTRNCGFVSKHENILLACWEQENNNRKYVIEILILANRIEWSNDRFVALGEMFQVWEN